jgi:hypothetical protein
MTGGSDKHFFPHHVQNGFGAHPSSILMIIGEYFHRDKSGET